MRRNYLTAGFAAPTRNETYAFINIFGLALGLAACLMLLLYVRDEIRNGARPADAGPRIFALERNVLAGLPALAIAIAIGTVSDNALRVSRTKPINALRYE